MPEADQSADPSGPAAPENASGVWSGYGVASAALGLVALAAVALVAVLWAGHRDAEEERAYQARAMQFAAEWTATLINMNADNVEVSLEQLRDGTVGELNSGFEGSIAPYREVVQKLRSRTAGQVESVSIEELHTGLDNDPAAGSAAGSVAAEMSSRTDTVLVVATSVSENAGTEAARAAAEDAQDARGARDGEDAGPAGPVTVRWNLRLGVSEVDGELMISRLESLR